MRSVLHDSQFRRQFHVSRDGWANGRWIAWTWLILAVLMMPSSVLADDFESDVGNVGEFGFDSLPNSVRPRWNLDNLEYPLESILIEQIDFNNRGLRIGQPDGNQAGRYTITLRASTHDWCPTEVDSANHVSVRLAAQYTGTVMIAASIPGAGSLVDLGGGRCVVWQRISGRDEKIDMTEQVKQKIPTWDSRELHTYRVEWTPQSTLGELPCRLMIDGIEVAHYRGHSRPVTFDPTFEISFESGKGTGLIDHVAWSINGGKPKSSTQFTVRTGVRQLFLDDLGVASTVGLRKSLHQPKRCSQNPVLKGEYPWEKTSTSVYGTMLFDRARQKFRLWYLCTGEKPTDGRNWLEVGGYRRVTNCTLLAYAESVDGIVWEKPFLKQLSYEGSLDNNLIQIGIDNPEGVGVLCDEYDPDPSRRYKAFFWDRRLTPPESKPTGIKDLDRIPIDPPCIDESVRSGGMWVAFSEDGIKWKTIGPVTSQASDTTHSILFDTNRNKFLGFGRMGFGRTVALCESDDAVHWSPPQRVLACDAGDGLGGQIYGMPTDLYEGLFVGMFWMYREEADALIDTQLAVSRDGRRWKRVAGRKTFFENSATGAWDDGMSRLGRGINVVGDSIVMHYSMVNGPHRSAKFPQVNRKYPGAIGLATLRRDGFVSWEAVDELGTLETPAFDYPGGGLSVNGMTEEGKLQVTMLNQDGDVLINGSDLLGDFPRGVAIPADQPGLPPVGMPIRLRFSFNRSRLYSYWFGTSE